MQDPDLRRTTYGRSSPTGSSGYSPRILSIGGGKGGIGKSFVSANLAVCLAKKGFTVSLVDLDLGAANLHTCLGVPNPKVGIFDFVNEKIDDLRDIAVETGIPGLKLYGGGQEFWQQVRPQSVQKVRLISKLQSLDSDYVILDLGAGTHVNTLDFFINQRLGRRWKMRFGARNLMDPDIRQTLINDLGSREERYGDQYVFRSYKRGITVSLTLSADF
jgi:Mrp family chromosome partitioning ATPase